MTEVFSNTDELLRAALGADAVYVVTEGDAPGALPTPTIVVAPASAEQVAEAVRVATDAGVGIVPVGGATAPRRSRNEDFPCVALSLGAVILFCKKHDVLKTRSTIQEVMNTCRSGSSHYFG